MEPGFEPRLSRTIVFVLNLCTVLPENSEKQNKQKKNKQVSQVQSNAAADPEGRLGRQDFVLSGEEPELDPSPPSCSFVPNSVKHDLQSVIYTAAQSLVIRTLFLGFCSCIIFRISQVR